MEAQNQLRNSFFNRKFNLKRISYLLIIRSSAVRFVSLFLFLGSPSKPSPSVTTEGRVVAITGRVVIVVLLGKEVITMVLGATIVILTL